MRTLYIVIFILLIAGCEKTQERRYPQYDLKTVYHVPDSLKSQQRQYIVDLVSAASYHMTGGDYEDADETIRQASRTAYQEFGSVRVGLEITYYPYQKTRIILMPEEMNQEQLEIYQQLLK